MKEGKENDDLQTRQLFKELMEVLTILQLIHSLVQSCNCH